MRPIKFRARRIDNNEWVYGHYVKTPITTEFDCDGQFLDTGTGRHCIVQDGIAFEVDPKTVGQFTGLKDKNGKEIYEGDIVKFFDKLIVAREQADEGELNLLKKIFERYDPLAKHESTAIVEWSTGLLYLRFEDNHIVNIGRFAENDLEVIGNIHEHPNLLK